MSTRVDSYPAASQAFVITLLVGLFDHQARFRADGGSFAPITRSTCSNVIGTTAAPERRR